MLDLGFILCACPNVLDTLSQEESYEKSMYVFGVHSVFRNDLLG